MTTIVIDSSAVMAILLDEPESERLISSLIAHPNRVMSAATRVELGIVAEARLGTRGRDAVERFVADFTVEVVPVDGAAGNRALAAWRRFGKDNHPAALTFGDCFSYAAADERGLPLLCAGDDFAATDLEVLGPA